MAEATISHLKNHLPEIVHDAEKGQDIQITRHGKPVAVIVSLERYNQAFGFGKGIFNAYLHWRTLHPDADGFTAKEIDNMRCREPHEVSGFSWD
jgi:prevent-host-death family protein